MSPKDKEPRLERRRLADLVSFPNQKQYFDDLSEDDLEKLGQAMRKGGVPPIEILPQNRAGFKNSTILRSHGRRAAERAGLTELEVLVRYDLAQASTEAIEREFLVDNVHRRHLDSLAKARAALRILTLEMGRKGKLTASQEAEVRERIAKMVGWSGRHLSRLWNVLRAPVEVQNAVRAGELPLVLAERVVWLTQTAKDDIVARIQAGEAPKDVVASYVASNAAMRRSSGDPVTFLVRGLARALRHVEGRIDELPPHRLRISLGRLQAAQEVLAALIARAAFGGDQVKDDSPTGAGQE